MRDSFSNFHPTVNLLYFILVITFSMVITHPVAQIISLICAILYLLGVEGKKSLLFLLKFCLPVVILTSFINPAFNHEGVTILFYFGSGNPLTLESLLYGIGAGVMLTVVLLWFSAFSRVMTTDKFIYLFGRVIPALSLVISMSLRFVPKFKKQTEIVVEAQRCIGRDISSGSLWQRFKTAVVIFSVMITWALENAIETADSMKSRGYGLKGRTAFSIYRMDDRDKYALLWLFFCGLFLVAGVMLSAFGFRYFPSVLYAAVDKTTLPFYTVYFGLCITPVVLNFAEDRKWKIIYSKM
jgi:energy-coupling factor transport system permease protein